MLNSIYNVDCVEGLKSVKENTIDLIVTSPPYNCGIPYDSWNDNLEWNDYKAWCTLWLYECYRVLKDDGRICINVLLDLGNKKIGRFSPFVDFRIMMSEVGFKHHGVALWTDQHRVKYTAWGSWVSPSAPYIYTPYETIIISYKNVWKKQNKGEATISKEDFMEGCSGVWNLSTETNKKYTAAFPERLPELCMKLLTWKNDIVLDPFMGSGTTAVAAIKNNRQYIGFEISPNYYKIALERISTVQKGLF